MDMQRVFPVIVSVAIIIAIAVVREYSETAAAITVTMPINVTLAMWIIFSAEPGDRPGFNQFVGAMFANIWPTVLFLLVAWLTTRAGWRVVPVLIAGYVSWAAGVGLILSLQRFFG